MSWFQYGKGHGPILCHSYVSALKGIPGRTPKIADVGLTEFIETVGKSMDAVGVAVIAIGALISVAGAATRLGKKTDVYTPLRRQLGASILLGLEFLVAANIIRTVAVTPDIRSVMVLGAIVLIRTFLSYSLQLEVTGYWPWQAARAKQAAQQNPPPGNR